MIQPDRVDIVVANLNTCFERAVSSKQSPRFIDSDRPAIYATAIKLFELIAADRIGVVGKVRDQIKLVIQAMRQYGATVPGLIGCAATKSGVTMRSSRSGVHTG